MFESKYFMQSETLLLERSVFMVEINEFLNKMH